jgi:hypothetical protein
MARVTTRPGTIRLPRRLPMPHTYQHCPETDRCAQAGCGLPRGNALRHLHDHTPDAHEPGRCARCGLPASDIRHQDPGMLPDVARLAAGDPVAA